MSLSKTSGFKLDGFEFYNWGTFDNTVWTIDPRGQSALLTGENGSGKSTIVDALLTLLVPNQKRNYNLASGSEKKERTELSYVRGAYGREQDELGQGQTKYLRSDTSYSVILGRFKNDLTGDTVTLGQFFWFETGTLKKIFFITHSLISIQKDFSQIKNTAEVRRRLKALPQTQTFSTFLEYQAYFIKVVGLRSEKGLDLFNQITAIKEISRLNEFVRKHMLDTQDTGELLDALYKNYENLSLSYQAIVLAKDQLEELGPLAADAKKNQLIQNRLNELKEQLQAVPLFFGEHKKAALLAQKASQDRKMTEVSAQLAIATESFGLLSFRKIELSRLLTQDDTGRELERMELVLGQQEERKKHRKRQADHYRRLLQSLKWSSGTTLKEFSKTLERANSEQRVLEQRQGELREQLYQVKKEKDGYQAQLEQLLPELQSVKLRKNRLPSSHAQVRAQLAETLGVSVQTIPFVAELIRVKDTAMEWTGALEKLLYSFALRLLVPNDLYASVVKVLNPRNIGIKLVFQKIEESTLSHVQSGARAATSIDSEHVFHKLDIQKKSPYAPWIQDQIIRRYDYSCVEQLADFQKRPKAITTTGLMKHGYNLNEKDDRFSIQDKSRFILGWDNQDKLEWLQHEIQGVQKKIDQCLGTIQKIEKSILATERDLATLRDLCLIQDYTSIDWESVAAEMAEAEKRMERMAGLQGKVGKIKKELEALEGEIQNTQAARDQYLQEQAIVRDSLKTLADEIARCDQVSLPVKAQLTVAWVDQILQKTKRKLSGLTIRDYDIAERLVSDEIIERMSGLERDAQQLQHAMVRKMSHFKARFSEHSVDLEASLEGLGEFLTIKTKLELESLPEHERRFRKLLSKSLLNDMAAFKSVLDLGYEEIEETMTRLNGALKEIRYSPATFVQLYSVKNKDVDIREFQSLLRNCLTDLQNSENQALELGTAFDRIKGLLDRLKTEERWCKKVTDVRNWADFFVKELDVATLDAKNFYSDSAGLSGGQKAKLAFTILGSAIAYQYGLKLTTLDLQATSFRFIVVDEAFSKSDEKNSHYAMDLFHKLGLQVMVITPNDKIHIVEPFVNSVFLTQMKESQDRSHVYCMRLSPSA